MYYISILNKLILVLLIIIMIKTPKHSHLPLLISPTNSTRYSIQKTETHKKDNRIRQLTQKLNRNLSYLTSQDKYLNAEDITLSRILTAVKTDVTKRSLDDIAILRYFLSTTSFTHKFKEDGIDILNYDKMFIIIATYATYLFVNNNDLIYDFNQNAVYSYVIAQGEVALYSPQMQSKELTGLEYYEKLMEMCDNDDLPLVELTVKHNENIYNVNYDDVDILKLILLKIEYNAGKSKYNITESFFKKLHINPKEIGINFEIMGQIAIDDKIKIIIKNIPDHLCEKYLFLNDNNVKQNVNVFVYGNYPKICKEGDFIGNICNDKINSYEKDVNVSVHIDKAISIGETHLIAMNNYIYDEYLIIENEHLKMKELSFLYDNFFFKSIVKRKFEREYFPLFTKQIFSKNDILYNENDDLQHIFFIQEGNIVLISNKSIVETHAMIKILQPYISISNERDNALYNDEDFPLLSHLPSQMASELHNKQKRKILIHHNKEILGIESLYGEWNYLFTAQATSDICSVYKISINDLVNIFHKEDSTVYEQFVNRSKLKIQMILQRLLNVNKASLQIIDRQICVYNPILNNNEGNTLNTTYTLEMKEQKSNNNINNSIHHRKVISCLSFSREGINDYKLKRLTCNNVTKISNIHSTSSNNVISKRTSGFRNKQINKILSLNDIGNGFSNSKHAFEERMLFKAKKDLRLSQKHLISQLDTFSSPNSLIDNNINNISKETAMAFLTTVNSNSNNPTSNMNPRKTFSVSNERKTNTTMNSTLKHSQAFRTPITKAKMKKYAIFDTGLDYFDFEGDFKHFKRKKHILHHESPDIKNKTFKNINTLSLKQIDGNINRTRYNFRMKQLNVLNSMKQAKNITYKHLIMKQIYKKLNPLSKK